MGNMKRLRLKRLERHRVGGRRDNMELSVPVPRSPSGKVYQYSPNPEAIPRLFQLGDKQDDRSIANEKLNRIRRDPGPGETVCPYSGYQGEDEEFIHVGDVEAVKKRIMWMMEADVQDWLRDYAKDFNRGQPRGGFLSVSMDFKPRRSLPPLSIREDLLRSLECDVCGRPYAVYALALFCPDCGAPNVAQHFRRQIELVADQITLASTQEAQDRAEFGYRLMGNAHEDVLTAFEAVLKTVYRHVVRHRAAEQAESLYPRNGVGSAFQNVDQARERYSNLGDDPFLALAPEELERLRQEIQKRHILGWSDPLKVVQIC